MAKDERCQCFCTKVAEWGMGDVVAKNGRCQCFCTKESERGWEMLWRRMRGVSAFVRR